MLCVVARRITFLNYDLIDDTVQRMQTASRQPIDTTPSQTSRH